jgi:glycosyltransferase involved in cell wall biosynthesis
LKISIVIPAYNEARTIFQTVSRLRSMYPEMEIIVVNDGSSDNTSEEAARAGAYVVNHPYNIGNGAAVKTGIRRASGDIVILMDGDGQHDPNDIKALLEHASSYDLVVGARDGHGQASMARRVANWCFNKLASYVAKFEIQDLTSGFRIFHRKEVLKYLYLFPNTFSYPTTSTLSYIRSGLTIKYVPIQVRKRAGDKSKIRILEDGFRFIIIILRIATICSPLRIFLPMSLIFFMLGAGYYCYTYLAFHRFTTMSMLLFSVSVMIFLMGLISDQIAQMRFDRLENS